MTSNRHIGTTPKLNSRDVNSRWKLWRLDLFLASRGALATRLTYDAQRSICDRASKLGGVRRGGDTRLKTRPQGGRISSMWLVGDHGNQLGRGLLFRSLDLDSPSRAFRLIQRVDWELHANHVTFCIPHCKLLLQPTFLIN